MSQNQNDQYSGQNQKPISDEQELAILQAVEAMENMSDTDEQAPEWNKEDALKTVQLVLLAGLEPDETIYYITLLKTGLFTPEHYEEVLTKAKAQLAAVDEQIEAQQREIDEMEVLDNNSRISLSGVYKSALTAVRDAIRQVGKSGMEAMEAFKGKVAKEEIAQIHKDLEA
jgi:repressor of nif and glnA expression